MNSAKLSLGAGIGALAVGAALLSFSPEKTTETTTETSPVARFESENTRVAVADVACLQAEGIDAEKVREVCKGGAWLRGASKQWLECVTDRVQVHKCEIPIEELPDAAFVKYMGCRCTIDGLIEDRLAFKPLGWTPPAACNCLTICPKLLRSRSQANVEDDLVQCLRERCVGCDITPNDWKACPHCLAPGRDCATECAPPPEPEPEPEPDGGVDGEAEDGGL